MAQQVKKPNDFKDNIKDATITKVYPQTKTLDCRFNSQDGELRGLNIPYSCVGGSAGSLRMPQAGERITLLYLSGDRPIAISSFPNNVEYLPFLYPGEISHSATDGSYLLLRNARKRDSQTGILLDYDTLESNNSNMEFEPGGLILQARSKKNQNGGSPAPRWYEHSYLSLYDNGDVAIQSQFQSKSKALIFMDGSSGALWLHGGNGTVQEYIELNPLTKEIVILTDGDVHQHTQNDWKITVYNNQVQNISNALQINLGVAPSQIPRNFDDINVDSDLGMGDARITNSGTQGTGNFYLHIKGNLEITVDQGNVDLMASQGDISVVAAQGNISAVANQGTMTASSHGDLTILSSEGNVDISSPHGDMTISSEGPLTLNATGTNTVINAQTLSASISQNLNAVVGGSTSIQSTGDVDISSSATVNITGAQVNIN